MRVRLRYRKHGKVRFTSHRDMARVFERTFRKVGLPVARSEGFSPRPRVSFGLALSTGHESEGEYLDVELVDGAGLVGPLGPTSGAVEPAALPALLSPVLPPGVEVTAAAAVAPRTPSLQEDVTSCTWRIEVIGAPRAEVEARVAAVLAAPSLVVARTRKGHEVHDDIRPAVRHLAVTGPSARGVLLEAELATQPRGLRPSELIGALGPGLDESSVCRLHQWIERDGARREPLPAGATWAPHAEARAS